MNIFILLILEVVFLSVAYLLFEKDILSPVVITIFVMLIGTIFVIPSIDLWDVKINENLLVVFFVGMSVCIIASWLGKKMVFKSKYTNVKAYNVRSIHFQKKTELMISLTAITLTILYLLDAIRVGTYYGGHGLGAIGYMKEAYLSKNGQVLMNPFIRQGFKIVMAFGYIASFALGKNVFTLNESIKKNLCFFIAFFCSCAITLFSGSRTEILRLISALIICCSFSYRRKYGWNSKTNMSSFFKICRTFIPLLIVTIIFAFMFRQIVKTQGTGGREITSIISYASFYIGSPIQVLNIKLSYFYDLQELFFGTRSILPEFVYLGSLNYGGNVATLLGTCVAYNGIFNMAIYLLIVYFFGTFLYYFSFLCRDKLKDDLKILIFSYIYCSFTLAYYSYCANLFLELSNIMVLVVTILLFIFLYKYRFVKRKVNNERYHSCRR